MDQRKTVALFQQETDCADTWNEVSALQAESRKLLSSSCRFDLEA